MTTGPGRRAGWAGRAALLAACAALPAAAAAADPRPDAAAARSPQVAPPPAPIARREAVTVRSGEHPGFSRVVFDLPGAAQPGLAPLADGLLVHIPAATLSRRGGVPRGLRDLVVAGDSATLSWPPGSATRTLRLPGRLVIDVLPAASRARAPDTGPAMRTGARAALRTLPRALPRALPRPAAPLIAPALATPPPATPPRAAAPPPALTPPARPPAPASAVTVASAAAAPTPLDIAARPERAGGVPGAVLPFSAGTGAAAFRRGRWGIAVFDEARPIDLSLLRADPALAGAQIQQLAAATVLRMPLPPGRALTVAHRADGWSVALTEAGPASRAILPVAASGRLELPLDRPGRVVPVPDPDSGGLLLVGTQDAPTSDSATPDAAAPHAAAPDPAAPQGVAVERRTPSFGLLATWRGVAVDPASDALVLRAEPAGFVLQDGSGGPGLALADAGLTGAPPDDAARYSRRFDLPAAPLAALDQRLRAAAAMAAALPPQDRGPARLRAAQAMLAMGMGAEAQGLVQLAVADDPRLEGDPFATALGGAGALLAGRSAEAAGLDDAALSAPGQPGADEVALWRGLLAAQRADAAGRADPAAAQILAAKLPLLQSYPATLRDRLLPLALQTMAQGGEAAAARRAVDASPADRRLDLARALLDEQDGHAPDALARLDQLASGADRDVAARAAVRAVELRLSARLLTPLQAADALDPLIDAWRGDARELRVRLLEAQLRLRAGQARPALALLRDSVDPVLSQGWPDQEDAVRQRLRASFAEAVADDAAQPLPPLEFVAMVQENADLLPDGAAGQGLAERVADRLAALDLPDQAAAALARLMQQAPPGAARAALGGRLAALQMQQGGPEAALTTLSASTGDGLPPRLVESRTLTFAQAVAARGDLAAAAGSLQALGTTPADALLASLLEGAAKWPEATAALRRLADRTLPPAGRLDEAQAGLLLRLAAAAAQAGDVGALATLRARDLSRVPSGKSADLLRVLTEGPVQGVADLPRAGAEMALARTALR